LLQCLSGFQGASFHKMVEQSAATQIPSAVIPLQRDKVVQSAPARVLGGQTLPTHEGWDRYLNNPWA
jgi:hypothetical protein